MLTTYPLPTSPRTKGQLPRLATAASESSRRILARNPNPYPDIPSLHHHNLPTYLAKRAAEPSGYPHVYRLIFANLQWHGSQFINDRLFASSSVPDDIGLPSYEQLQILKNEGRLLEQPVSTGPSYADAVNAPPPDNTESTPADLPETVPTEPPQTIVAAPVIPVTVTSVAPPIAPPTTAPVPSTSTPMATPTTSGGLRGLAPTVFTSDRSKTSGKPKST
ncbi:hypothetical protein EDB85DRAFT_2147320 [Lactarius pseudohatsudake]|nr:hypothetical protein EDB85DRAFT_2147320 [Lactarius pseudohatsudake]